MYYSSGNYEAFASPKKPEGIDNKYAHIVGTGLAGLAAACFLIRDAQMPGDHITLYEHLPRRMAHATASMTPPRASSCAADAKWITILNACGICSNPSPR